MRESVASTISELVDVLEKRYPNNIFVLQEQSDKESYIAKLEMIREIKKIGGITNE